MTLIREEQPPPGSFDWLLAPDAGDTLPEVEKPRRRVWPDRRLSRKVATRQEADAPPPTPPERPGGNPHVRVELVINHRPARSQARHSGRWMLAALIWAVIAFILMAAVVGKGHAEQWRTHRDGFLTRTDGDNGDRATSYQQGFETLTTIDRADGSTQHCRSWQQGWQTFTECTK